MDDQKEDHYDSKRPLKRNHSSSIRHDCVEYTNGTNQGGDLPFANKLWTVPQRTEKILQGTRGMGELQYIDQYILKESKTRRKNLAMAWIADKKAYDMFPQSWSINCIKMYKISDEVIEFL